MEKGFQMKKGWETFKLPFGIGTSREELLGTGAEQKIKMRFFRRKSDRAAVGYVWFAGEAAGPPSAAHGGLLSFVMDEALGTACWLKGYPSVAVKLEFILQKMSPTETVLEIESKVVSVSGKKIEVVAEIRHGDTGEVFTTGKGTFIRLPKDRMLEFYKSAGYPAPSPGEFLFLEDEKNS